MTKMNRRDYLRGMGAVAGTIASAGGLEVLAQHRHETATPPGQQKAKDKLKVDLSKIFERSGPRKFDLRSTESVKLIFSGLMAFSPDAGKCVVSFYSKENGKHRHHLRIKIFRKEGDSCILMGDEIQVARGTPMELQVTMPDVLNRVHYLQLEPLRDGTFQDLDFRNVPNLEGPDWYYDDLTVKGDAYSPSLIVDNGLFYTHKRTTSTFRRQTDAGTHVLELGSIADYIGTNIYLKAGGQVKLTVLGKVIPPLPQVSGVQYEIQFHNHCFNKQKNKPCLDEFVPYHLMDKTERNDFYMNYEALHNPPTPEYLLVIASKGPRATPDICGSPGRVSDESPCAGVGYGGLGGFPGFP